MKTQLNTSVTIQPQQTASSPETGCPTFAPLSSPGKATVRTAITPSELARILAPIPAFLSAITVGKGDSCSVYDEGCDEREDRGIIRLAYRLSVRLFGAEETPFDAGVAALLRANRHGYSVPHKYPLYITVEMSVNARLRYFDGEVDCLLVFSVSQQANVAACREHARFLLQYLVQPDNIRPLDENERAILGRLPGRRSA